MTARLAAFALLLLGLAELAAAAPPPLRGAVGMAYQTWNKPLGVWQTPEQLEFDLAELEKLGVRSLRVEWVWNELEPAPGELDFTLPDRLVAAAKRHGMTLMPLIGFQWPPGWVGPEHRLGYMPRRPGAAAVEPSPLGNYADPWLRDRFARFITAVTRRYRGERAISAFILGNEFSYLEYETTRQLGWDPITFGAFRRFLAARYHKVEALNRAWGTALGSFADVGWDHVRIEADEDTTRPAVRDFLDFRRRTLAEMIGVGCRAARAGDPRALRTYSSIGVLFSQFDANVTSEDWGEIARACRAAGAPLSFLSLNSYPNLNSRLSFDLGLSVEMGRAATGLDVVLTEMGVTSTEQYLNIAEEKQGKYLAALVRQAIADGVRTPHVFTWSDKRFVSGRERGFGLVREKRQPKPALGALARLVGELSRIDLPRLLGEVRPAAPRVTFLLPDGTAQWNSWLNECWMVASQLRRLGLGVDYLAPARLREAAPPLGAALVLCRQNDLGLPALEAVRDRVLPRGVHVLALAGAPGLLHRAEDPARWDRLMKELFGLAFDERDALDRPRERPAWVRPNDSPAYFTTWAAHPPRGVDPEGRRDLGRMLLGRQPRPPLLELPFAFVKAAPSGATAAYVPVALGYVFASGDDVLPYHQVAAGLGELVAAWRLPGWRPLSAAATADVLGHRAVPLAGGGVLVYAEHLPRLERDDRWACPKREATLSLPAALGPLVDLVSGQAVPADAEGRGRLRLRACESTLLVSAGRRAGLLAAEAQPPFTAAPEAARRRVFPPRVYYENLGDAPPCLPRWLEGIGFVSAAPGVQHSPDYRTWYVEPARGYYATGGRALDHWNDLFGVVALDHAAGLSPEDAQKLIGFLADPDHRALVTAPAEAVPALRARLGGHPGRLWVGACEQPPALERFLFPD